MKNRDIDSHNEKRLVELVTDLIKRVTVLEQAEELQNVRIELLYDMIQDHLTLCHGAVGQ